MNIPNNASRSLGSWETFNVDAMSLMVCNRVCKIRQLTKTTTPLIQWIHQYFNVNDTETISAMDKISLDSLQTLMVYKQENKVHQEEK
mmetsp:Transcript_46925/g.52491  ORF Transcript_46925/g.52491 Transcript_46925/m.52491 type:complete len:88 (-) Transcript_46925:777-1040(-)